MQAVKYLYKYIFKGPDRAQTKIENINQNNVKKMMLTKFRNSLMPVMFLL